MKPKINKIIELWIGEDEKMEVCNEKGDMCCSPENNAINQTLQDLRNKIPELTDKIAEEVVGEIEKIKHYELGNQRIFETPEYRELVFKIFEDFTNLIKK
jgi:hypothetical protein